MRVQKALQDLYTARARMADEQSRQFATTLGGGSKVADLSHAAAWRSAAQAHMDQLVMVLERLQGSLREVQQQLVVAHEQVATARHQLAVVEHHRSSYEAAARLAEETAAEQDAADAWQVVHADIRSREK